MDRAEARVKVGGVVAAGVRVRVMDRATARVEVRGRVAARGRAGVRIQVRGRIRGGGRAAEKITDVPQGSRPPSGASPGDWSPDPCPSPWSWDGVLALLRALPQGMRRGGWGVNENQCPIPSMEGFDPGARGSLARDLEG